jgi:hypothetical protein
MPALRLSAPEAHLRAVRLANPYLAYPARTGAGRKPIGLASAGIAAKGV